MQKKENHTVPNVTNVTNFTKPQDLLEMNAINYFLTNSSFIVWLHVMEAIEKEIYERNSGTAYETYTQSI